MCLRFQRECFRYLDFTGPPLVWNQSVRSVAFLATSPICGGRCKLAFVEEKEASQSNSCSSLMLSWFEFSFISAIIPTNILIGSWNHSSTKLPKSTFCLIYLHSNVEIVNMGFDFVFHSREDTEVFRLQNKQDKDISLTEWGEQQEHFRYIQEALNT